MESIHKMIKNDSDKQTKSFQTELEPTLSQSIS